MGMDSAESPYRRDRTNSKKGSNLYHKDVICRYPFTSEMHQYVQCRKGFEFEVKKHVTHLIAKQLSRPKKYLFFTAQLVWDCSKGLVVGPIYGANRQKDFDSIVLR